MIIVEAWAKWTEDTQIQSVRLVVEIVTRNQSAVRTLIIPYPEFTNNECDMFKLVWFFTTSILSGRIKSLTTRSIYVMNSNATKFMFYRWCTHMVEIWSIFFFIFNMHKIFYCQKIGTNQVSFQLTIQPNTISFILLIVCLYLLLKMKHNRYALHIDFVEWLVWFYNSPTSE